MKSLTLIAVFSLFGSAFALFSPSDDLLLVIDAGHGGKDAGYTTEEVKEADINLTWALELKRQAEDAGIRTVLTRDSDKFLELQERVDILHSHLNENTVFISLHQDGSSDETKSGAMINIGPGYEPNHMFVCEKMLGNLLTEYTVGLTESDFFVIRNPKCPSYIISLGYMSNASDLENINSAEYRANFNKLLLEGLLK